MPNYMFLAMNGGPDVESAPMEDWMAWFKAQGDNLVDMGAPLTERISIGTDQTSGAMGYMVLKAADMDAAKALADSCPAKRGGLEVLEMMDMSEMHS